METRIVGASRSLIKLDWQWPIHGLRHPVVGDTTGWYIWTGQFSSAADFFSPWHEDHLVAAVPEIADLLALPPGSRFLLAPDFRDVWEDPALLEV
jgi:hypothetical protein